MNTRNVLLIATLVLFAVTPSVAQQPVAPALPPVVATEPAQIAVSELDATLWERYQLLQRLASSQLETLRLQNEKTLADEYAKLNQRFLEHYKLSVDQIERRGDQWIPRLPPAPSRPAPAK